MREKQNDLDALLASLGERIKRLERHLTHPEQPRPEVPSREPLRSTGSLDTPLPSPNHILPHLVVLTGLVLLVVVTVVLNDAWALGFLPIVGVCACVFLTRGAIVRPVLIVYAYGSVFGFIGLIQKSLDDPKSNGAIDGWLFLGTFGAWYTASIASAYRGYSRIALCSLLATAVYFFVMCSNLGDVL